MVEKAENVQCHHSQLLYEMLESQGDKIFQNKGDGWVLPSLEIRQTISRINFNASNEKQSLCNKIAT